ncbi:amidohydrolase [Pseudoalteromonas sp. McH1-42]|uniref:amidohydrolase n=1 Tax=Pseudoalteromonas sp. McH1-42 TaxID=2917752 RepID=UPI001EF43B39|nr:amidohydrolase [Pseudoalteromonas sp. McH1-42]MCG7564263.1 amidohydrolase [Pseudoalteromonas sp. McH1-42]
MSALTVALVQQAIEWLAPQNNFVQLERLLDAQQAQLSGCDLIILPETFATGFALAEACAEPPEQGEALAFLHQLAQRWQAVVAGSVLVDLGEKKANRFYWCWPDGTVRYYDKRHLFCLGKEGDYVHAGQERVVVEVKGFRILPQVCYDLRFPVFQRNRNDYDVMINVANWPAARRRIWDTLLQARAIENQCYVLGCNRIGDDGYGTAHNGGTAAYDFTGALLAGAPDDAVDVLVVSLEKAPLDTFKQGFPAHLDADDFVLPALEKGPRDE